MCHSPLVAHTASAVRCECGGIAGACLYYYVRQCSSSNTSSALVRYSAGRDATNATRSLLIFRKFSEITACVRDCVQVTILLTHTYHLHDRAARVLNARIVCALCFG